jgi:hypothetical protein
MGLFDRFKAKPKAIPQTEPERLENFPEMLTVKLLFQKKPILNVVDILNELRLYFDEVENNINLDTIEALVFSFPNIRVDLLDANGPAQCAVFVPKNDPPKIDIDETALQQNWHWSEANEVAKKCSYELLITDLLTRTLDYKRRLAMYMNFLVALIKITRPDVIYSVCGQKLINPEQLLKNWEDEDRPILDCLCNVRLYNITGSKPGLLMDTVGLNAIGLPDFQIRFSNFESNEIANLLWNYAYYIYDRGDIIENGNTMEGIEKGSRWRCQRTISPIQPERMIVNVMPE